MNIQSVMTPRLLAIADSVPFGATVADVGTDHGYIPIYLYKEHKIERALAMDLRQGPLSRAEENIDRFGLKDFIKTRLSDGLCALSEGEADTAVIAGMGGLLIAEILEKSPVKLDFYILQPMTATAELREYLAQNDYEITDERLAKEDNKIYTVMTVKHGKMTVLDPVYYQVGEKLIENRDPLLPELLDLLIHKYSEALGGLLRAEKVDTRAKTDVYKMVLTGLKRLKEACDLW
ncbi:MAG: SAM-dependent methyltransferase [Ruminococcaceae bacterium]|nr:SAM-dependent methyltransferase [Oscillospiraceae bacterium]